MVRTLVEIQDGRVTVTYGDKKMYTEDEVADLQTSEAELVSTPMNARIADLQAQVADLLVENKRASDWGHELEVKLGRERDRVAMLKAEAGADHRPNGIWAKYQTATAELQQERNRLVELQIRVAALEGKLKQGEDLVGNLEVRVRGYDEDRRTEQARANENMTRAKKAEAELVECRKVADDANVAMIELRQVQRQSLAARDRLLAECSHERNELAKKVHAVREILVVVTLPDEAVQSGQALVLMGAVRDALKVLDQA